MNSIVSIATVATGPQAIRPALAQGSLADVFAARVTTPKVAATVDRVAGAIDLPDAVHRYVRQRGLAPGDVRPASGEIGVELGDDVERDLLEGVAVGDAINEWHNDVQTREQGAIVFAESFQHPGALLRYDFDRLRDKDDGENQYDEG